MAETTTLVSGQTVFFHELSDQEMGSASQTLPTTFYSRNLQQDPP